MFAENMCPGRARVCVCACVRVCARLKSERASEKRVREKRTTTSVFAFSGAELYDEGYTQSPHLNFHNFSF